MKMVASEPLGLTPQSSTTESATTVESCHCEAEDSSNESGGDVCCTGKTQSVSDPATPPCRHNTWSRVRKMRGKWGVLLRCFVCRRSWVTRMELHDKCPEFYSGTCEKGGHCTRPHIYARGSTPQGLEVQTDGSHLSVSQPSLRTLKDERKKAKKQRSAAEEGSSRKDDASSDADSASACPKGETAIAWLSEELAVSTQVYRHDPYSTSTILVYC